MTTIPGIALGITFSFILIAINSVFLKLNKFSSGIGKKNYLRLSMAITILLCLAMAILDGDSTDGGWIILLFAGFQGICILTSYLIPETNPNEEIDKDRTRPAATNRPSHD